MKRPHVCMKSQNSQSEFSAISSKVPASSLFIPISLGNDLSCIKTAWCAKRSRVYVRHFHFSFKHFLFLSIGFLPFFLVFSTLPLAHLQVNTSVFSLQVLHLTKQHHWNLQLHCHTRVYWWVLWPRPQHIRLQPSVWGDVWLHRRPLVPALPVAASSSQ